MAKKQKKTKFSLLFFGVFLVLLFAFSYYYSKNASASTQVTATADTTTTSTTYVQMDSMTVTPGAGDYFVSFSTSIKKSVGTSTQDVELFVGGVAVTHTARQSEGDSSYDSGDIFVIPVTIHAYVSGVGASDAIEIQWKTTSGTATAMERTLIVEPVDSADMSQVTATADTTTTSGTDVQVDSMTLTPGAGDYMIYFGSSVENTSISSTIFSVYVNGVQVDHSERDLYTEFSFPNTFYPVSLHSFVSGVGAGQAIEIRWRRTGGTSRLTERTLVLQKVDSANVTQVTATTGTNTTSTSDVLMDSMTATPGAGDYLIYFGSSIGGGVDLLNETINFAIYVNGAKVAHTERQILVEESMNDGASFPVSTLAFVSGVGAGQTVEVHWRTTGDTVTISERTLTLVKVGSGAVASVNFGAIGGTVPVAVAHWKFDEGQGTTASNSIVNEQNLALSSSSWSNSGKYGKSWDGDGAKWASIADADTAGKFDFVASDDFSISLWLKSDSTTNPVATEYLLSKAEAGAGYRIYVQNDGSGMVYFGIDDDTGWTPGDSVSSGTDIYDNDWHHVVAVKQGTSRIQLYVDGILRQEDASIIETGTLENATTLYLGDRNGANGGDEFFGDLDDVQIFRSALSSEQVRVLYNGNAQSVLGSASVSSSGVADRSSAAWYCVPGDSASCVGPVGHWTFDENGGNMAYDTSTNQNSATITPGVGGYKPGKIGASYDFDGVNTTITAGSGSSLDNLPSTGMSLSAWIYPRSRGLNNVGAIIFKNNGVNPSAGWYFRLGGTYNLTFAVDGSTDLSVVTNNNVVAQNAWNHVELSWDGVITTASSVHIYVNGVEVAYSTVTNGAARVDDGASNLYIGNDSSLSRTFDGLIDDVKIYNYARTGSQVSWDYNQGKPVGWWKMDECSGTTLNDSMGVIAAGTIAPGASGNTSVGSCSSGTSTEMWNDGTTGKRNSGLGFDSTDDAVSFAADSRLNLNAGGSIAAWIKPNSTGENSFGRIIDKSSDTSGTGGYGFQMDSGSNQFYGEIAGSTCISSPNAITMSVWNHVVWTFDGTNWKLYSNGVLNKTCSNTNLPPTTSLGVTIGNRQGATDRTFDGLIDDVRIYNYPLTATQVKSVMNDSVVNIGPSVGLP